MPSSWQQLHAALSSIVRHFVDTLRKRLGTHRGAGKLRALPFTLEQLLPFAHR